MLLSKQLYKSIVDDLRTLKTVFGQLDILLSFLYTLGNSSGPRQPGNSRGRRHFRGHRQLCVDKTAGSRTPSPEFSSPMFNIRTVKGSAEDSIKVDVHVDDVPVTMKLDTGAAYSIISKATWKRLIPTLELEEVDLQLLTYTGERLTVLGQAFVKVEQKGQEFLLPLIVVDGQGPPLFGRNWPQKIRLNWMSIKQVSTRLDQLLKKYGDIFQNELGTLKGIQTKLVVQENATPKFFKPRSVPYAIRGAIYRKRFGTSREPRSYRKNQL